MDKKISLEIVEKNKEEALFIFNEREEESVRETSFHPEQRDFEAFYKTFYFKYFSNSNFPPLYVLYQGERIGLLSFTERKSEYEAPLVEISLFIKKEKRKEGLGKEALKKGIAFLFSSGVAGIVAKIRKENTTSLSLFKKMGFKKEKEMTYTVSDTLKTYEIEELVLWNEKKEKIKQAFIIAEAGSNWKVGSFEEDVSQAKRLILAAKHAGADAVKFQVFRAKSTYAKNAGEADYLEENIEALFKDLEMPYEMIPILAEFAFQEKIEWMASVFSLEDFEKVDPFVKRHKIASYEIGFLPLIEKVALSQKPLILSTGASSLEEIEEAVSCFKEANGKDLTLLQCTAIYPAPLETMNLQVISLLKEKFKEEVGLSDHSLSPLYAPLGAVFLGATVIEKHFTLDKTLKGPDHSFALEPHEFKEMVAHIKEAEKARGVRYKEVQEEEKELFHFAKRGIQALCPIFKGEKFVFGKNIDFLRPGKNTKGASFLFVKKIEGKKASKDIQEGEGIIDSFQN